MSRDMECLKDAYDICEFYSDKHDKLNSYAGTEVEHMAYIASVSIELLIKTIERVHAKRHEDKSDGNKI